MFPLKNYKYEIPEGDALGAFGVKRKFDVHTGVDLYCEEGDLVYAIEDGEVVAVMPFTGDIAGFPWWNNTYAIAISGASGIINYGEIQPDVLIKPTDKITKGTILGYVIPVLKVDKGKVPSTSMLHVELYNEYEGFWTEWELDKDQPENLENPTELLKKQLLK